MSLLSLVAACIRFHKIFTINLEFSYAETQPTATLNQKKLEALTLKRVISF